jgi:SAM-dependent methyltransferase
MSAATNSIMMSREELLAHYARVRAHYRALAPAYRRQANQTCEGRYREIVRRVMSGRSRVLELGSGSNALLDSVGPPGSVACDLSIDMLQQRRTVARTASVVGGGEQLPFRDGAFDGVYHINVIEHVADVEAVIAEGARVLQPGGMLAAVTPNGNWERWLDLAESWRMKIPEGPHTFLTTRALGSAVGRWFEVVEHRTFLACPGGPSSLSAAVDRLPGLAHLRWGFFQYVVARRN